ncbi:AEC family transporter [Ramlibacter humi]|uniref:AEC family transporter n=1 Tax=Ramlibacter humi TaxID=2530451 RepID=UPI001EF0BE56|nr:AEC family transporter [Ramlibacter humi]
MDFARLLFPDFSLIAIGYLVCRFTPLDRTVWDSVDRLVYYLLFPVLLFHSVVRNPLDLVAMSSLVGAGLLLGISGIGMAYALPRLPFVGAHIDRREHAGAAQVAFRFNSFIALALAERVAGAQGVQLLAVLIGVCVPLFNVGAVWPMARHGQTGLAGALVRNPLIIATFSGLAFNLLGLRIPDFLVPTITRIGGASLALGLMAAGAGMQFGSLSQSRVLTVSVLAIRHFFLPLVAAALIVLFRLDTPQALVLLSFSAMPTASSCYVLASRMGYNGSYVAGLVTLSTMLGVASLTFALGVLR